MLEEERSIPQLIIIDGGKGQLSSAMKSIEKLGLREKMTVIGIAKKLEEIAEVVKAGAVGFKVYLR